uniref:Uncharacterized protein n=1 Tax=Romanomermis culicivorax TaxID=13658 RepID=A0A915K9F7_ROMCU
MIHVTNASNFPQDTLNRLEETLTRCKWIVPVLPHQELQTLLRSALSQQKLNKDKDEFCNKFIHNCLPLCFSRLMNDEAVKDWKSDVQRHILDCTALFVELCSLYFESGDLTDVTIFLDILGLIFNPKNKFHSHNCQKRYGSFEKNRIEVTTSDNNNENSVITLSPLSSEEEDWLVFLLNHFGKCGGFKKLSQRIEECDNSQINCSLIYSVLKPFAQCYLFLTEETVKLYFAKILERFGKYMQNVSDEEIKKETKTSTMAAFSNVEAFKDSNTILIDAAKFLRNLTDSCSGTIFCQNELPKRNESASVFIKYVLSVTSLFGQ